MLLYNLQYFAKDGPGGEKTEEPTSKKLEDARKEGQVAKSKEIASSLILFGLFLMLKLYSGIMGEDFLENFHLYFGKIPDAVKLINGRVEIRTFTDIVSGAIIKMVLTCLPFLLMGFLVSFLADIIQVKWKPTTKPLKPKFSKLNPINGIKRLFSLQSLVELLKSLLKIGVIILVITGDIKKAYNMLFMLYDMPLMQAVLLISNLIVNIGFKISAIFLIIAAGDLLFQKWKFHEDMKMTKQEVKDEYKNAEGDPQVKSQIKARMRQASQRRMMNNLPKADVVITNPTHYAVAIVYDREMGVAPIVIAKGADYMAQKIKEKARENDIEIVENKPLARSLYRSVEIGEQVPPELYVAVAEVLAYVYKLKGKV